MSGVSVRYLDEDLQRALRDMAARSGDMTPAMREIGAAIQALVDLSFRSQTDPWGGRWAGLADVTRARRRGTSAHILRDTGRLANSISARADASGVRVGTDVVYAAVHQFGNPNNRMYNTPRGHPAPNPARRFLPIRNGGADIPRDTQMESLDILNRHLGRR